MKKASDQLIRVMTYNIHKGIGGVDRKYRPDRIIETISHYDPDFALLQEVDNDVPRSRRDRQVDLLANSLGYRYRNYQPNVRLKQGRYGNAILSRFPFQQTWNINLTIPIKKRRRALIVKTKVPVGSHSRTILICNTHLGLAGFERAIQLKRILACDPIKHLHRDTPAIVAGDFNDVWSSLGRRLMFPSGFQCAVGRVKTFPAAMPVRGLDALYFRGEIRLTKSFVGHTATAKRASDHLPVIADFQLGD